MAGIFISKGMNVGIPAGGLTLAIGEDGKPKGSLALHLHFDVCPTWLDLALRHLSEARTCESERNLAWSAADAERKGPTLEREFEASMQAIVAAATAFDAFYAVLRKKAEVPDDLVKTWRARRTSRAAQVCEVLRLAFGLSGRGFSALRKNLTEIYRLRDLAVHPAGHLGEAVLHPELGVGVEWRFAYFRHANADAVVRTTFRMLSEMVTCGHSRNAAVRTYAEGIRVRLEQLGTVIKRVEDPKELPDESGA